MKSVKTLLILAISFGVVALATGCSKSNLPCDTDPSQIQGARAELQSAQSSLDDAKSEVAKAKSDKDRLNGQINGLPDPEDLEETLETLKKGSGR